MTGRNEPKLSRLHIPDLGRRSRTTAGSNPLLPAAAHQLHDARSGAFTFRYRLTCPSRPPSCAWFENAGCWGTTMPVTRDSPSIQRDVPGPDPARAPPNKAIAQAGLLVGGSGGGLPCLARSAARSAAAPTGGACWSTFGPHAIGTERSLAVTTGTSFAQVADAILGKQARVQNLDKDAVPVGAPSGALRTA